VALQIRKGLGFYGLSYRLCSNAADVAAGISQDELGATIHASYSAQVHRVVCPGRLLIGPALDLFYALVVEQFNSRSKCVIAKTPAQLPLLFVVSFL
jgi:hypothetical protein